MHVDLKTHSLAVLRSLREICSFDRAGRMISFFDGEAHYWRGLSGRMVRKWTDERGHKQAVVLEPEAALGVLEWARHLLREVPDPGPEVRTVIERALAYDPAAGQAAYHRVYGQVGILPPDQYLAVVLQVATGCSWNRCTFCHFYRDQTYHRRTVAEFRDHVGAVRGFLGESLLLRRSIFLGDADALAVPQSELVEMFRIARDGLGLADFYAFAEAVSIARRPPGELAELARLGFRRIYIGAESGHDALLEALDKRSRRADVVAAVRALHEAGLRAGLIFLAGVGDAVHVAATLDLVAELAPALGDLVYLSRLWGAPEELAGAQLRDLQRAFAGWKQQGVKVSPYDVRQFVY